ncbi:MAG: PQQ-binding-like beta-propeller repeat protein [Planctomycetota bacterium]
MISIYVRTLFLVLLVHLCVSGVNFFEGSSPIRSATGSQPTKRVRHQLAKDQWPQFGHHSGWQTNLNFRKCSSLRLVWEQSPGEGKSQVVGNLQNVFVTSGTIETRGEVSFAITKVACLSMTDGTIVWTKQFETQTNENQETFGGNKLTPQSTPCIAGQKLIFADFVGRLFCVDLETGNLNWELDTSADLGAESVQFGFTSSPVLHPKNSNQIVVLAAGPTGGLYKLNSQDGSVLWKSPAKNFSYATPVYSKIGNKSQWIAVTRDEIIGVADEDGKRLWSWKLPNPGLTNVPSPMVIDNGQILVAGQGVGGTACLKINFRDEKYETQTVWTNPRMKFFYTNWIALDRNISLGCTENYLTAFLNQSGQQLGRWRGFGDGNLIAGVDSCLLVNGKGKLSTLIRTDDGMSVEHEATIGNGRYWTPPTQIGTFILIRNSEKLSCFKMETDSSKSVANNGRESEPIQQLVFNQALPADPAKQIMDTYETKGQVAALALYAKFRKQGKLTAEIRIELAETAYQSSLMPLAKMIMDHAVQDLPKSKLIRNKLKEWSKGK